MEYKWVNNHIVSRLLKLLEAAWSDEVNNQVAILNRCYIEQCRLEEHLFILNRSVG